MSLFNTILSKLGLKNAAAQGQQQAQQPMQQQQQAQQPQVQPQQRPQQQRPMAISEVDVVAKLEGLAASNPEKLNWRVSIVDLMKLLGLDSSLAARRELADELGCPPDKMADSAQMNMWLHKTVLRKLAENGGNVPQDLLN